MWETYIIQSINYKRYYIGYSQNAIYRLAQYHNEGKCKSTKHYIPYKIIKIEKFKTKTEALKREKQLKKMKNGNEFKKIIERSGVESR
jgi:putative endonuclease